MEKSSTAEAVVVGLVFLAVFGMKQLDRPSPERPTLAADASGVQLNVGALNLVVQVASQ